MSLHDALDSAWRRADSMLCVGLDPDPSRFPAVVGGSVLDFCRAIVDATADLVCAFKPQIAYFAARGAERELEQVCAHVRDHCPGVVLVLDAKRGDIGSTAEQYAREAFDRYGAHAVTVNPYMGGDTVEPFLRHPGGGVFVLCRTSNPGSGDFQSLDVNGTPLYEHVARRVLEWNSIGDCGLVVGATYPGELRRVRDIVGDLPLLVPGIGAQGGDAAATVAAGTAPSGYGMVVNSSRAVLYASAGNDFAEAARVEALRTRDALRAAAR
jgi:orotidine-5'-phosphate decarboxylase